MLFLNDTNRTVIIENIYTPILSDSFWVLDLEMMDYTITPLLTLEEIISPSISLQIAGFNFNLPASWNILVCDKDTSQLDLVECSQLAGKDFNAFIYGQNKWKFDSDQIRVTNYNPQYVHTSPSLNKHQMLCHPISQTEWINITPSDIFNRYLKNKTAGDIV